MRNTSSPFIADIGTGSGCIALALAKERKDARVVATDLSKDALKLASENTRLHGLEVELLEGSLTDPLEAKGYQLDIVVSNPPYVPSKGPATAEPNVLKYEPHQALLAGKDGLCVLRPLIQSVPKILRPGGWFVTEMALTQASSVQRIFEENSFVEVRIRTDLADRPRAVFGQKPSSSPS